MKTLSRFLSASLDWRRQNPLRLAAACLVAGHLVTPGARAQGPPPADAVARLLAATRAAVARAPEVDAARALADALRAGAAAEGAAGGPYTEFQQEGIGPGWDDQPNALTSVRLGVPFNLPWQASAARDLRRAADDAAVAELAVADVAIVARAASLWLELAAAEARFEVARRARERLDLALALHEERYTLGEVAGFDVAQLDLEQVRAAGEESVGGAERDRLAAALRRLAGEGAPPPLAGDLALLVDAIIVATVAEVGLESLEGAPEVVAASRYQVAAEARRELVATTAWGRLEAEAEWEHVPSLGGDDGFDALGLRLNVPLPMGRAVGAARAEAAAAARLATAAARLAGRRVADAVDADLAAVTSAERRLSALEPILERLPQAERSLAEQFRLGAQSYLVYLDGMARFDDVRLDAVAARHDLLQARLRLAATLSRPDLFPLPDPVLEEVAP